MEDRASYQTGTAAPEPPPLTTEELVAHYARHADRDLSALTWYTVMAVTDPDLGANGISAFMVHKDAVKDLLERFAKHASPRK